MCEKEKNTGYLGTTRPTVDIQLARDIITEYFGLTSLEIIELESSGDRNFKVSTQKEDIQVVYILKVVNSHESIPFFHEAIGSIMDHLLQNGFVTSKIIPTKDGKSFLRLPLPTSSGKSELCLVKLLIYLPGQPLRSLSTNSSTQFELGQLLAEFHFTLKDFPPAGLSVDPNNPWGAENPLVVLKYLTPSLSEEIIEIVTKISKTLHRTLHDPTANLTKGVIHGDIRDLNIIINQEHPTSEIKQKYGMIDFNDLCYSFIILDVGWLIADQLLAYTEQALQKECRPTGGTFPKDSTEDMTQIGNDNLPKNVNGDEMQKDSSGDTISKEPNGKTLQKNQFQTDNIIVKDPNGEQLRKKHNGDTIRKEPNNNFQNVGLQNDGKLRKDVIEFQLNNFLDDKNYYDLITTAVHGDALIDITLQILQGYLSITELSPLDLSALYWSIGGSFSQNLVLCEYNKIHQPGNPFAAEASRNSDILIQEWDKINPETFLERVSNLSH
ncbi:hypothetical protein LOTGIDRAFT_173240 [Lottia gigantea]|uniref:Hydroxylysine kinase n=1 Tax=Lottia gigantea TaxID=225164 RepID=V4B255_LOTGI|nr:hypothetical protein LOTGIDRAFT_173240 [Lottia gigantea]ESP00337.1 hypothetical protein LOTGIDRAFT_173240 [Lottia gigantea]